MISRLEADTRFASLRSWAWQAPRSLAAGMEQFFVPDRLLGGGTVDRRDHQLRYRRMVGFVVIISVACFPPSMLVAGVPTHLWLPFTAGVAVTAIAIAMSLLAVPANSKAVYVAAVISALSLYGLDQLIGDYYHQAALLFALVVAGHTVIQGVRPALVMAICGAFIVPLTTTLGLGGTAVENFYAFVYLLGLLLVVWSYARLADRHAAARSTSETKYRELVEHVPAVVYTADFGADGVWHYVSPRVKELLGFPAESWTGDPTFWWKRLHPDDHARVLDEETRHWASPPGTRQQVEYRMIDRDGQTRWISDEAVAVAQEGGSSDRWSGFLVDITDRKELEEQLHHQAFHDPLTGLANRALFADRVEHALSRGHRRRDALAVLFLDLDDFKTVNDGIGHEAGDALLVNVGSAIRSCLRPMDTVARLGGDEFAILLEDLPDADAAAAAAERILDALSNPFEIAGREIVVSASIGLAYAGRNTKAADLLRNADNAMYAAKRGGKGRHEVFAPAMHEAAVRRLELAGEIRQGLSRGEFEVYYQPTVRLGDGAISGFEALVRWNHPNRGLVGPLGFIPEAEESGQIIALGEFVMREACRQARAWLDTHPELRDFTISVNVSAKQFRDQSLPGSVGAALASSRSPRAP